MMKSIIDCMKSPYLIPQKDQSSAKLTEPNNLPIHGMMMYWTRDVTILLNAAPITTAIAKSKTLPLSANSLNSFNIKHNPSFKIYF